MSDDQEGTTEGSSPWVKVKNRTKKGLGYVHVALNCLFLGSLCFVVSPDGWNRVRDYRDRHVVVALASDYRISDIKLSPEDFRQIKCLAVNSYFEARGEGPKGMEAVDEVVFNRYEAKKTDYPDRLCQVVYQSDRDSAGEPIRNHCQFSWYCDGKRHEVNDLGAYEEAYQVAYNKYTYRGLVPDVLPKGADHYHNDSVNPDWKRLTFLGKLGHHLFYRR